MNLEKIMTKLLLSCKEATCLIEKQSVFPLTFKERCRLSIHLKMCVVCNHYKRQSETMEKALAKWINMEGSPEEVLPPKSKKRIVEKIKEDKFFLSGNVFLSD